MSAQTVLAPSSRVVFYSSSRVSGTVAFFHFILWSRRMTSSCARFRRMVLVGVSAVLESCD